MREVSSSSRRRSSAALASEAATAEGAIKAAFLRHIDEQQHEAGFGAPGSALAADKPKEREKSRRR
ncbi:MAG TPA: hypothetical protein VN832_12050 [Stellaceae bacterium]|nr:hypothetical protein [Stellaceae bacterium]